MYFLTKKGAPKTMWNS